MRLQIARMVKPRLLVSAATLLLAAAVDACRCGAGPSNTSERPTPTSSLGFSPILAEGPAVWVIDGQDFEIRATYFLILKGRLQFTVEYNCEDECAPVGDDWSDATALAIACPLMRHVVAHRLYERGEVRALGGRRLATELIGVALMHRFAGVERSFRVSRTVAEISAACARQPNP